MMSRTYWYAWWGILAAFVLFGQVLNTFAGEGFTWPRWIIALTSAAAWTVVPLLIGLRQPDSTRRFAFWWGTSVPIVVYLPLLVVVALGQADISLPLIFWTSYLLILALGVLGGGIAVVILWARRRALEKKSSASVSRREEQASEVNMEAATKVCPFCAEDIKVAAIKCKHCGSELLPQTD